MRVQRARWLIIIWLLVGWQAGFAQGYGPMREAPAVDRGVPALLREIRIEQRLDAPLPLDAVFDDEERRAVPLGRYFGERPVILALIYFDCPMLCTQVLNGLVDSLKALRFEPGREFDVVAISFDATERNKPGLAAAKKQAWLAHYGRPEAAGGVHFLTGEETSIHRVTEAAGFHFQWDSVTRQFAHASGVMIATPGGRMSRYFYGIEYAPRDLRLGLIEAAEGRIGSPVDALLLYCYHYDPMTGRYSAVVMNILRLVGLVFLGAALLFYIFVGRRRGDWRGRARAAEGGSA